MNVLSKYTWITWYNKLQDYRYYLKQKRLYQDKKKSSILSIDKIDDEIIRDVIPEIRLFAIMRNESLRIEYFIKYYKQQEVDRFLIIDNNSTDESVKIALQYDYVHIFQTKDSYVNHWYWMEHLSEKYGKGHWCIVVDIDELLYFPHAEALSIPKLCQFLDNTGNTALRALLLDMYSDKPVKETAYIPGQNPLDTIPYFDTAHYEVTFPYFDRKRWQSFSSTHFTGGMRERVFGKTRHVTSLNKFPLFKYTPGTYLGQGMHAINGAIVSDLQGVVFHTKFLSDSIEEAQEESIREQHFDGASAYKDFKRQFDQSPALCLATPDSVRFRDSAQLVELGLMKTNERFDEFARNQARDSISKVQ